MSLIRNITLALAAAGIAGCAGSPAWDKPKVRSRLVEEKTAVEKPAAPKAPAIEYTDVEVKLTYGAEDNQTADLIRAYAVLIEKDEATAASIADNDKNGVVSFGEISDSISVYRKDKGIGELTLRPVKGGETLQYTGKVRMPKSDVSAFNEKYANATLYEKVQMLAKSK